MKALLVLGLLVLAGCHGVGPDAGHEAVLIQKPWFFGHGGVVDAPVKTGLTFVAWSTSGVDVNMQPQRVEVDLPDTMTSDGVPIAFHAVLTLQVTDSVRLVRDFGENWYQNNLAQPAAQQQRIETEKQKKLAEDQRMLAEQSRAAADNAYRQAMQLSPDQFLALETIKMQHDVCGPTGKGTCTFIQNGATPVLNLGK